MKIFILEDDPARVAAFRVALAGTMLSTSDNVEESKLILEEVKDFDALFLDHDLGGEIYVDSQESNTGYQLAKWIAESGMHYPQIFIHSMNAVGASNMKIALADSADEVFQYPFPLLIAQLRRNEYDVGS